MTTTNGAGSAVGGLVGELGLATLSGGVSSAAVSGSSYYVGGLVGFTNIQSIITGSHASGPVSGRSWVGGLIGELSYGDGQIINSYASGAVSSPNGSFVGGLAGGSIGSISSSYALGNVTCSSDCSDVGGLVGHNRGTIESAFATGNVFGDDDIGGLVGWNGTANSQTVNAVIDNSYATGQVSAVFSYVGGLVGVNNYGTITNSYATGGIALTFQHSLFPNDSINDGHGSGGVIGRNYDGTVSNIYWDTGTTGQVYGVGADYKNDVRQDPATDTTTTGLTTAQLQGTLPPGFSSSIWATGGGLYPYLKAFYPNGAHAISGYAYTAASTAAAGASVSLYANGAQLGSTVYSGANGYYYDLLPAGTVTTRTPIGTVMTLAGATGVSGLGFNDSFAASGSDITNPNVLAGRIYGSVLLPTWSATLAEMSSAFGATRFAGLQTTSPFNLIDIYGSLPTFTVDVARDVTGTFKITGASIIDAAPITVENGGTVMFISNGALAINAPITIKGNGLADLRYDYALVQHGGTVDPSALSFGTGDSLTFLTATGAAATGSQGGQLKVNNAPYTLVYSMAQLDAIDGVNGVTGATVTTYGPGTSGNYALAGNLDASAQTYSQSLIGNRFSGTFEGLGHALSNLSINSTSVSYAGLFSDSSGVIRDLSLANLSLTGQAGQVGGLTGENEGTLIYVAAARTVANQAGAGANANTGGIVGQNQGLVKNATFAGNVSANFADTNSSVGGLVGRNADDTGTVAAYIIGSSSSGSVSGGYAVGGLAGVNNSFNNPAYIDQSYSLAGVSGHNIIGGGLVGVNYATVTNSYAGGAVNGGGTSWYIGGLVGFEGYGIGSVATSYAFGGVSNAGQAPDGSTNVGGLVSGSGTAVTNAYWDTQATGQATSSGGTGETTAQLQSGTLPTGFSSTIWTATSGHYPKLKAVSGQ